MGLPGRRERERSRKEKRNIKCPSCSEETVVKVQKKDNIKKVTATDGSTKILDTDFDKTVDDAFTNKTTQECAECSTDLTILKSYAPR